CRKFFIDAVHLQRSGSRSSHFPRAHGDGNHAALHCDPYCVRNSPTRNVMATYLKRRISAEVTDELDRKVRQTVEAILDDVRKRGDRAVRELSEKFDRWSPASFRLSKADLDAIVAKVPASTLADIKFAQAQIRQFAEAQRAALRDIEV